MTVIHAMWKLTKWTIKIALIITGILPFFRCGSGYKEKDGKIIFNGEVITNKSFIVLSEEFGKDSTTAYYKTSPFEYADVATFEAVDEHYAKDKNKVYYCDEYREGQNYYLTKRQTISELNNAIPQYFSSLEHGYAMDTKHAWFEGVAFAVKDVASLRSINSHFAKDDVHAYYDRQPVTGSDGKTFEVINFEYAKDKMHIYFYGFTDVNHTSIKRISCDKETFEILTYPYSKDTLSVFYQGRKILNAHSPSFKILGNKYSIDEDAVYYEAARMEEANASAFVQFKENDSSNSEFRYAKDDRSVFINNKRIKGADVATFKVLQLGYSRDILHVYYKSIVVEDASLESFKTYEHGYGDADAEDSKHKYLEGKIVLPE